MRHADLQQRLLDAVLNAPGHASRELRRAALARANQLGGGSRKPPDRLPASLAPYVDKVARHAYQVTDADIIALRRGGSSEDAVFEITVAASLGAALGRLERGLAVLRGD